MEFFLDVLLKKKKKKTVSIPEVSVKAGSMRYVLFGSSCTRRATRVLVTRVSASLARPTIAITINSFVHRAVDRDFPSSLPLSLKTRGRRLTPWRADKLPAICTSPRRRCGLPIGRAGENIARTTTEILDGTLPGPIRIQDVERNRDPPRSEILEVEEGRGYRLFDCLGDGFRNSPEFHGVQSVLHNVR